MKEKRERLIDWITQMDEQGLDELIEEYLQDSKWKHYNGIEYKVIAIANEENTEKYPTQVIYKGENGKVWSRLLSDWHRSFTEI